MIPNCMGCEHEKDFVETYSCLGLHFAGKGLYEKGHLVMIMVNNKGEVIVS